MRSIRSLSIVASPVVIALVLAILGPTALGDDRLGRRGGQVTVTHGPVTITLVDPISDGHQPGDLRVTSVALSDETGMIVGRIDATLTTTAVDVPNTGDEIRIGELVFTLGDAANQVVVSGSSVYPAAGATIAVGASTIRPVVGGSGRYAGATGWAETWHLDDGTWRHTLHLLLPGSARGRLAGPRSWASPSPGVGTAAGIVRNLLGEALPGTAPGERLALWRHTIPAGAALAPHAHPGWQVARIVAGTLSYTIVSGEATVLARNGTSEIHGAGETIMLRSGDFIVENPDLVHYGANHGSVPVVIVAASLFTDGSPPATAVEPDSSPAVSAAP